MIMTAGVYHVIPKACTLAGVYHVILKACSLAGVYLVTMTALVWQVCTI